LAAPSQIKRITSISRENTEGFPVKKKQTISVIKNQGTGQRTTVDQISNRVHEAGAYLFYKKSQSFSQNKILNPYKLGRKLPGLAHGKIRKHLLTRLTCWNNMTTVI
jgi:hypothetical protein